MSYVLGCDVAKTKIDVSFVDANGQELWRDVVANEATALATLVLAIAGNYPDEVWRCVVEATCSYHFLLCEIAFALQVPCLIYNPLLTKQQLRATVRGRKTDRTDALMVARLGLRGEGYPYRPEPYRAAKYQARSYRKLSQLGNAFKLHVRHLNDVCPDDVTDETKALMEGIQTAITAARKQLYADIAASADGDIFQCLQTITGIGPYIAASLIGEVQDMARFKTAKALIAYSGLDPKIRRSGHTLNATGKLTKRGSSYLRRSIFIAASSARRYDPVFRALYDKKRSEGKSYTVAVCVVARKLLTVIRAVWLSGQAYDVEFATKH
jgi:transposase